MKTLELEGTRDEIVAQLPDFDGQRIHVTVRPTEEEAAEVRPQLTQSSPAKRITDKLLAIMADLPAEEAAKLPEDWAEQHDHYIYGTPKR